ncbi:MAG: SCO1664 family protein [Anaerolineales bacterium]|nr:MAG: SCO1664 family protein [Anaerolineales bacterium]
MVPIETSRWLQLEVLESTLEILRTGEIEIVGQLTWGSNYTFLAQGQADAGQLPAIYKPERGERPLWDFPYGSLSDRELAAFITSQTLGWSLVPPTIKREEAPAGPGSLQLYVEADPEIHYFTLSEETKQRLRPTALFDLIINNADRKSGHILIDEDDHLWLIDHGVCFHEEYKVRTVIWDFVGEEIPQAFLASIQKLIEDLAPERELRRVLSTCLSDSEIRALIDRSSKILMDPVFPAPGPGRPYPWPLV